MDWITRYCWIGILISIYLVNIVSTQGCKNIAFVDTIISRRHWSGEHISVKYGKAEHYKLVKRLGKGSYGEAYLGVDTDHDDLSCVIKIFTSKMAFHKMLREILILQTVCGGPNIMKLYDVIKETSEGHPALVLEYVRSSDADVDAVYKSLSPAEVQFYMRELLTALAYIHKMEIIHRDIKPHNVLIDPTKRELRVIDFGLAMFHEYDVTNKTLAGTKAYEAPEILVHYRAYDYKIDMWSFGMIFGSLIFRKFPLFHGASSAAMLEQIVRVLGSDDLEHWLKAVEKPYNSSSSVYSIQKSRQSLSMLAQPGSDLYASKEALDLLDKLLRWNPDERPSARDALSHPYFKLRFASSQGSPNATAARNP